MVNHFPSLQTIEIGIDRVVKHRDYIEFLENIIQQIKINPDLRSCYRPLTVVSLIRLNIDKLIRLTQILYYEKLVNKKLFFEFKQINRDSN